MRLIGRLFLACAALTLAAWMTSSAEDRAQCMRKAQWGVMTHFLADESDRVKWRSSRWLNGRIDGALPHMLSYLGQTWGKGSPRFTDDQVIQWTRELVQNGSAVTWDVPIQPGGLISEPFLRQLAELGKALARHRTAIKTTGNELAP